MAFKKIFQQEVISESPIALFRDTKVRSIENLWDHQAEMLKKYDEISKREEKKERPIKDIAIELPTGSGKTLIGILIGEHRRRKNKEKVVYLCPTKQLACQVAEQCNTKFGIPVELFTGKQSDYKLESKNNYREGKKIAITTYNGVFNTNPFFNDADVIIFDDAHSAGNTISDFWSLDINRYDNFDTYQEIINLFKESLGKFIYERLMTKTPHIADMQESEKICQLDFDKNLLALDELLDRKVVKTSLAYSWNFLRNNLHACSMYITYTNILIRPLIPPILEFDPIKNSKQRIYMTATLGESGELERSIGVDKIIKLPIVEGWDKQGIGRRFFIFPERKFNESDIDIFIVKAIQLAKRAVILVEDNKTAEKYEKLIKQYIDIPIFYARDIEQSKDRFIQSERAVAILANRFDGMDFSGNECRLLLVHGLPAATNIQEKFFIKKLGAGTLYRERIRAKIIQAIGRCTRGPIDYSAVCILKENLITELAGEEMLKYYHPELQAELKFGKEISMSVDSMGDMLENLEIFLNHSQEWNEQEIEILGERDRREQEALPNQQKLQDTAPKEVQVQYAYWNQDYRRAVQLIQQIIDTLSGDDVVGYRGYWYYMKGCLEYKLFSLGNEEFKSCFIQSFNSASVTCKRVPWIHNIIGKIRKDENSGVDLYSSFQIERIENELSKYQPTKRKLWNKIDIINKNLLDVGTTFEEGQRALGELIGFEAGNKESSGAPDPWWIISNDLCIVFEDKIYDNAQTTIPIKDIRESKTHEDWIKSNLSTRLLKGATILTVFVTNATSIDKNANFINKENIYYWNLEDFMEYAINMLGWVKIINNTYAGQGNLEWRKMAEEMMIADAYTPHKLLQQITSKKLSDLTQR